MFSVNIVDRVKKLGFSSSVTLALPKNIWAGRNSVATTEELISPHFLRSMPIFCDVLQSNRQTRKKIVRNRTAKRDSSSLPRFVIVSSCTFCSPSVVIATIVLECVRQHNAIQLIFVLFKCEFRTLHVTSRHFQLHFVFRWTYSARHLCRAHF